jgi:hypothetical protein
VAYCSQADANDAAPAQIAAHSASDDNNNMIHSASLVTATATSHPDRAAGGGLRGGSKSLTEYACCDKNLRTTSPSLDWQTGIAS